MSIVDQNAERERRERKFAAETGTAVATTKTTAVAVADNRSARDQYLDELAPASIVMKSNKPLKEVSLKKAFELMRKPETRLVKMFTRASPEGFAHYVLPGGYVSSATAEKIKQHPLVHASKDGLFPGHDQTWRLGD